MLAVLYRLTFKEKPRSGDPGKVPLRESRRVFSVTSSLVALPLLVPIGRQQSFRETRLSFWWLWPSSQHNFLSVCFGTSQWWVVLGCCVWEDRQFCESQKSHHLALPDSEQGEEWAFPDATGWRWMVFGYSDWQSSRTAILWTPWSILRKKT